MRFISLIPIILVACTSPQEDVISNTVTDTSVETRNVSLVDTLIEEEGLGLDENETVVTTEATRPQSIPYYEDTIKTIHVFVALCDNEHQGIVPVPASIGNGKDIRNNLYWGAGYGVKNFFKRKSPKWKLVKTIPIKDSIILERILYKHTSKNVYLLADAYDGELIQTCTEDFLKASNQQDIQVIQHDSMSLGFGGAADLVSYVGHNGLMDFSVEIDYTNSAGNDVMILCCYAKNYFGKHIKSAYALPILWTTHLMAPEAYTLEAAINGWIEGKSNKEIDEIAAQKYNEYQRCGIRGARNLFTTGF